MTLLPLNLPEKRLLRDIYFGHMGVIQYDRAGKFLRAACAELERQGYLYWKTADKTWYLSQPGVEEAIRQNHVGAADLYKT